MFQCLSSTTLSTLAGPGLEKLSISASPSFFKTVRLYENCSCLRILKFQSSEPHDHLVAILRACSGQLQSLDIEGGYIGERAISAIASNCSGLKRLRLAFVASMKYGLTDIWKTVGATLEYLCFRPPKIADLDWADEIPSFCSNVTSIELIGTLAYRSSIVRMIRRFGKQLRRLIFMTSCACLPPQDLQHILTACPHALVDAQVISSVPATIQALGVRLRRLEMPGTRGSDTLIDFKSCVNLEELQVASSVRVGMRPFMENFFFSPKPKLRVLQLDGFLQHLSVLDKITRHVATVEEFSCAVSVRCLGTFEKFALSNPSLKHVFIKFNALNFDELETLRSLGMITHFALCPVLKQLDIDFVSPKLRPEKMAEVCDKFRGRDIDVLSIVHSICLSEAANNNMRGILPLKRGMIV